MQPEKRARTPEEVLARREARVDRRALGSMPELWGRLIDLYGRPMPRVRALSPERAINDFPRLAQLRWIGGGGRWVNLGPPGAEGDGAIALVMWLSGAPRERCVDFLEETLAGECQESCAWGPFSIRF